jgi:hypothetical protein
VRTGAAPAANSMARLVMVWLRSELDLGPDPGTQ